MLVVTDTETGRTGTLVQRGGYVLGSQYVNPSWEISWNDTWIEMEEADD